MKSVGSGREVNRWTYGRDSNQGPPASPLTCELEHEIAAHRIPDECYRLEREPAREMLDYCAYISGKIGVIESGRKRFGVAAIAHVHANNIAAIRPGARRYALDVARVR